MTEATKVVKEEFKEKTGDTYEVKNTPSFATTEEIGKLKEKINKSMEQLVKLVLKVKRDVEAVEDRIAIFNTKAGHKL